VAVAVLAASISGCREPFQSLGAYGPGAAPQERAAQLLTALQLRVTNPTRDQKYDSARVRIASGAMLPSRVWRDSSVWTSSTASRRQLLIRGHVTPSGYRMDAVPAVAFPSALAEARHQVELARLSDDEYAWDTDVPFVLGAVRAADVGRMFAAMFAAAEGRTEADVRADYRGALPRASAIMGQLFRVDSIRIVPIADRSTSVTYSASMTPSGVENRYPAFAKYLEKYVSGARMRWTLTDAHGALYFECTVADSRMQLRVRTLRGKMMALYGPSRPMPDSLTLNGDMSVRIGSFGVGFRNYHADLQLVSTGDERALSIVSRQEPDWELPLITERLLRTPLRRPFQGSGAQLRIGVRDSAGAPTILRRRLHLEVQESAILRFLARLGAIAIKDYAGDVEREEMAYLREVFTALLADLGT
jgi:hypothetical protein